MKMATVFDNSEPVSMIRRQSGMISVERRKCMTELLSFCWNGRQLATKRRDSDEWDLDEGSDDAQRGEP